MKLLKILFFLVTTFCFVSCEKKFLDSPLPGVGVIKSTQDYDLLLNSGKFCDVNWSAVTLSDNYELDPTSVPGGSFGALYTWQDQPYGDGDPELWSGPYRAIYYSNLIINEVDLSDGGTTQQKARIKAEARLARADALFFLLQFFAKPFDPSTSDKDPGVPIVLTSDMYASLPGRGTVKQCYDFVVSELKLSLQDLPRSSVQSVRGSKAAAFGLLSRVYLHLRDYDNVVKFADSCLAISSNILDYTRVGVPFFNSKNSEHIYLRNITEVNYAFSATISSEASMLFSPLDSRYLNYFLFPLFSNYSVSIPEVYLNKAEALVRRATPDLNQALNIVNYINIRRDGMYFPASGTSQSRVLDIVLDERRRELLVSVLRWFDMRRLAKEGRVSTVTRVVGPTTYTLLPNDKKYTLLIPTIVMRFNPNMQQNDR